MTYSCGCVNEVHAPSGVLRSVSKCEFHLEHSRTHPEGETIEYFKELGCFDSQGIPQNKRLIDELLDPLEEMDIVIDDHATVLEIGCGLGAYIPMFGRNYIAVEKSKFACEWVKNCFDAIVTNRKFEDYNLGEGNWFDVILGAHVFEHMKDAPYQLCRCLDALKRRGKLIMIVPDDSDPTNPDHLWFFTQQTLHALLDTIGFVNIKSTTRKRVPQENFIYCVAEKP